MIKSWIIKMFRICISLHEERSLHYIKVSGPEFHITKNAFNSYIIAVLRGNLFSITVSMAQSPTDKVKFMR
jgi:hypothetical protein